MSDCVCVTGGSKWTFTAPLKRNCFDNLLYLSAAMHSLLRELYLCCKCTEGSWHCSAALQSFGEGLFKLKVYYSHYSRNYVKDMRMNTIVLVNEYLILILEQLSVKNKSNESKMLTCFFNFNFY